MIVRGPFSRASGNQEISLGPNTAYTWHEVAISLFDANGDPIDNPSTGSLQLETNAIGADRGTLMSQVVNLTTGQRRWRPFFERLESVTVRPSADLAADVHYTVTIVSGMSPSVIIGTDLLGRKGAMPPPFDPTEITRRFIEARAVMQSRVDTSPVNTDQDFEFEMPFYRADTSATGQFLFANQNSANAYGMNLYATGDFGADAGTASIFSVVGGASVSGLSANRLYTIGFRYTASSTLLEALLDGDVVGSANATLPAGFNDSTSMRIYGRPQGSGFFANALSTGLRIWTGGHRDTGTLVRDYELKDPLINSVYIANSAAPLGVELAAPLASWLPTESATFAAGILTTTAAFRGIYTDLTGLTVGATYRVAIPFGACSAGFDQIYVYETAAFGTISEQFGIVENGTPEFTFTATATSQRLYIRRNTSGTCEVNGASVREAPGAGQAFGLGAADSEDYTLLSDTMGWLQVANRALISSTPVLGDSGPSEFSANIFSPVASEGYRIGATVSQVIGTPTADSGWTTARGIPVSPPFRLSGAALAVGAIIGGDFVATSSGDQVLFGRNTAQVAYDEITAHRILRTP